MNTQRRSSKRINSPSRTSPSIATMLLLVLCFAMFSSSSAFSPSTQGRRAMRTRTNSVGDHTRFYAPTATTAIYTNNAQPVRPPITSLLYSRGVEQDEDYTTTASGPPSAIRTRLTGLWSNIFTPSPSPAGAAAAVPVTGSSTSTVSPVDKEQLVVDEYLEFLDKRYHRLHDDEEAAPSKKKKQFQFSAWEWLTDNSGTNNNHQSKQKHEPMDLQMERNNDALYVLGVAGLASERLLQKHQISTAAKSDDAIETTATTVLPASRASMLSSHAADGILSQLAMRRRALIRYQDRQLKRLVAVVLSAVAKTPRQLQKATKALWTHGGAKKTLTVAVTALCALVVLIRPVLTMMGEFFIESGFINP